MPSLKSRFFSSQGHQGQKRSKGSKNEKCPKSSKTCGESIEGWKQSTKLKLYAVLLFSIQSIAGLRKNYISYDKKF